MYAAVRVFNNEKTIRESLLSSLPYMEKIVIVDGAFTRFPHISESGASTDKTKQFCHKLCGSKLLWIDSKKPLSEVAKNNLMLKHIPLNEWFLWIDADEVIEGEVAKTIEFAETSNLKIIGVRIKNFHPVWHGYKIKYKGSHPYVYLDPPIPKKKWSNLKWKPYYGMSGRLIRKTPRLQFKGHHHRLYIGTHKRKVLLRYETSLEDILITNMHYKVGWKRWHQKIKYKRECYEAGEWR